MNIAGAEYNINHRAYEVYVAGCSSRCPGCHNPELWDYNVGVDWKQFRFNIPPFAEQIWIMGGDPLDQPVKELVSFLKFLRSGCSGLKIWVWTGHMDEFPSPVFDLVDYIKCGPYKQELEEVCLDEYGITLASSNQDIFRAGYRW